MPLSDDEYRDIQGLVRFGYKHLAAARFHLLTIADAAAARSWLSNAPVTTAVKGRRPDTALQVAFTYEGLQKLGGAPKTLAQFPYEFQSGMTEMDEATLLKKLRWRCRRGMRELDQLFERYLDREWATAPTEEREVFLRLLDCEDEKLWRWFMGYEVCPDAELTDLIARIRALPA